MFWASLIHNVHELCKTKEIREEKKIIFMIIALGWMNAFVVKADNINSGRYVRLHITTKHMIKPTTSEPARIITTIPIMSGAYIKHKKYVKKIKEKTIKHMKMCQGRLCASFIFPFVLGTSFSFLLNIIIYIIHKFFKSTIYIFQMKSRKNWKQFKPMYRYVSLNWNWQLVVVAVCRCQWRRLRQSWWWCNSRSNNNNNKNNKNGSSMKMKWKKAKLHHCHWRV